MNITINSNKNQSRNIPTSGISGGCLTMTCPQLVQVSLCCLAGEEVMDSRSKQRLGELIIWAWVEGKMDGTIVIIGTIWDLLPKPGFPVLIFEPENCSTPENGADVLQVLVFGRRAPGRSYLCWKQLWGRFGRWEMIGGYYLWFKANSTYFLR